MKGCFPELQKKWSGGWNKIQVKFIRVVHNEQWWYYWLPFLYPKCSMAFTTFMYSLTLPKTMFAIQPLGHGNADKKLGPSVLGPAFAMDEMTGPICFRRKFFSHHQIFPVDGLAVSVIRVWEVTTLAHKLQNNAMKEKSLSP